MIRPRTRVEKVQRLALIVSVCTMVLTLASVALVELLGELEHERDAAAAQCPHDPPDPVPAL